MTRKIGKYELQSEIGRGGFGTVHRAFDPTVGRVVAVKLLTASEDSTVLSRFRLEATAAGNLHHKNIVTIYDFGQHEGMPYLVMEFLEGEDLQKAMNQRRPLSLIEKMQIMRQVAEGLHCAHQHGVIHRDIKPANIMVLPDSCVKLMDFGIARMTDPDASRHTQSGFLVGTLLYMSPEQLGGGDANVGADIWAYGVILYELLTGVHPFGAVDMATVMYKIVSTEPEPIQSLLPECPEGLPNLVQRALTKDPDVRYQSLEDLKFDLEPVLLDLQKKQAQHMVSEAQGLFKDQRWTDAQILVRKILDLDASNQEARKLRESLHQKVQIAPRVEALIKGGDDEFEKRNFESALRSYESALRLDQSDAAIRARINRVQQALEQSKKVLNLLRAARTELQSQNLTGAHGFASEAVEVDPEDSQAAALLKRVQEEIAKRERERSLQQGLSKARGLLTVDAYDEAIEVLTTLAGEVPESVTVSQLLTQARLEKQDREQREKLSRDIEKAKNLVKGGRLMDASHLLKPLLERWPDHTELGRIYSYIEDQLALEARSRAVETVRQRAQKLLDAGQFQEAIRMLDQGLKTYPGESSLQQLLSSSLSRMRAREREDKIVQLKVRCEELERQDQILEALQHLELSSPELKNDPVLVALKANLQKKWEQQQKLAAVREVLAKAETMIATMDLSKAVQLLENKCAEYPDAAELQDARARSIRLKEENDRRQFVDAEVLKANEAEQRSDFQTALAILEAAASKVPNDPNLTARISRTLAAAEAFKRANEIGRERARIERMLASVSLDDAGQAIEEARKRFSGVAVFGELKAQLQDLQKAQARRADVAGKLEAIQNSVKSGDLPGALVLINKSQIEYPEEASFRDLGRQIQKRLEERRARERKQDIDRRAQQIKDALAAKNYAGSLRLAADAELAYPGEELFKNLSAEIKQAQKQSQLEQARADIKRRTIAIDQAIADGEFRQALEGITSAQAAYPTEAVFQQRLAALNRRQAEAREQEVKRDIARRKTAITEAIGKGTFPEAFALIGSALQAHPGEEQFSELHREATRAQEAARSEHRRQEVVAATASIQKALAANELSRAAELISSARRQFPDQSVFNNLLDDLNSRVKNKNIEDAFATIGAAVDGKDFAKAKELVKRAMSVYSGETRFRVLSQTVERAAKHHDCLSEAERELRKAHFPAAEKAVREALKYTSDTSAANELLRRIEAERFNAEEQQQLRRMLGEIQKLNRAEHFDLAAERAREALTRFPNHPQFQDQLQTAEAGRQRLNAARQLELAAAVEQKTPAPEPARDDDVLTDSDEEVAKARNRRWRWFAAAAAAALITVALYLAGGNHTTASPTLQPALSTSVQGLSFQFKVGETPDSKTIHVESDKPVQLSATADRTWLTIAPAKPMAPATMEVMVNPALLDQKEGRYEGKITIAAADYPNLTRSIPVEVRVAPAPIVAKKEESARSTASLAFIPTSIDFAYIKGAANLPESKYVNISATDKSSFAFGVKNATGNNWLTVSPVQGSSLPTRIAFSVNPQGLQAGAYSTRVDIFPQDDLSKRKRIEVKLTVSEPPVAPPPAPKPVEPTPEPKPPEPFVARVYHGPTKGDISWRGNLAPGKTVVFGAGGLEEGSPGSALGNKFPSRVKITVTIEPPSVRAQVEPNEANQYNKLVLVNEGATTVTSIEVHWAQVK